MSRPQKPTAADPRSRPADPAPPRRGEHAIVIGASIAGLLAARVLSDFYDRVTLLERDVLTDDVTHGRRAIPQGRHSHALQFGGRRALGQLFDGLTGESLRAGAPSMKTEELRVHALGNPLPRVAGGPQVAITSRPLLESLLRRRVRAIANVDVLDGWAVAELTGDSARVTGVRARDRRPGNAEQTLRADVVVAASGRGGKVPAWLERIGGERPAEERIHLDLLYASRRVRLRPAAALADKMVVNLPSPDRPRGIAMLLGEDDAWVVTLYGYGAAHHPPSDEAGWLAFAAGVTDPDVVAAIEAAEPLGEIVTHAYPAGVRRRYDRLAHLPEGLLVMGDALCSFNPIYGQGMSVAALEAVALRDCLLEGAERLSRRYLDAVRDPVEDAWKLAMHTDLALPGVGAMPTLRDRVASRYLARLLAVAAHDAVVARAFLAVYGMVAPLSRLRRPAIMRRVLRGVPRGSAAPSVADPQRPAAAVDRQVAHAAGTRP